MSQTKAQLIQPIGVVTASGVVVTGVVTASSFDGDVVGSATSIISGANLNVGIISATNFSGDFTGTATGIKTGADIKVGSFTATNFTGDFTGTATSMMRGTGFEAGAINATGFNVSGTTTGNVTGDVTGNIAGNVTGNVTGNVIAGTAGSVASGSNIHIGVMTATSYVGDGSNLTGIAATNYNTQTVAASSFSINVTSPAGGSYTLSGTDRNGTVSGSGDPTVTIQVGDTVNFVVDASGHPFYLRVSDGGANVGGATNQGTQSGTVSWTPNNDAAGTYYYQCGNHAGMLGTITVTATTTIDLSAGNVITFDQSSSTTVAFANTEAAMDVTLIRKASGAYNLSYSTGGVVFTGSGGTDDYLSIPDDADFDFATGDFTIEWWMYMTSNSSNNPVIIGANGGWYFQTKTGDTVLSFYTGVTEYTSTATALSNSTWHHIAISRSGTSLKVFVDGKARISETDSDNVNLAADLNIGRFGAGSLYYTGKLSNIRIVKGTAVYTDNFIPPLEPLNNISGTVLLCGQSSSSTTASVVTPGTITAHNSPTAAAQTISLSGTNGFVSSTITWPSSVQWNGGTAPTLISDTQSGDSQQFQFLTRDSGVTWYAWEPYKRDLENLSVFMWGKNEMGELGQNQSYAQLNGASSPMQIPGDWKSVEIAFFGQSSGGIKADGTLWMWGSNRNGSAGINEAGPKAYSSPIQVGTDTTWSLSSSADEARLAVKTDGTLWSWGYNTYGGLGLNHTNKRSSPVLIPGTWSTSGNQQISVAKSGSAAIKADGTLWVWGENSQGMLGQNESFPGNNYSSPVQIPGLWSNVFMDYRSGSGVKTDGTLWSWGYNASGESAQNQISTISFSSPVQIPGTNWSISGGKGKTWKYTLKTDGTMWAYGNGGDGVFGQGIQDVKRSSPIQIPGSWKTTEIVRGYYLTAGMKTDGTLWVWGGNENGMLGQNSPGGAKESSPVQIPGTSWHSLHHGYGGAHMAATQKTYP